MLRLLKPGNHDLPDPRASRNPGSQPPERAVFFGLKDLVGRRTSSHTSILPARLVEHKNFFTILFT
jgi:hypothetical protein